MKENPENEPLAPGPIFFDSRRETNVALLVLFGMVERAIETFTNDLAARADLDPRQRLEIFDGFIRQLVTDAKNADTEGATEADEAEGKRKTLRIVGNWARLFRKQIK